MTLSPTHFKTLREKLERKEEGVERTREEGGRKNRKGGSVIERYGEGEETKVGE